LSRILILAANPQDTDRLRLGEEVREIQAALEESPNRNEFEVIPQWEVRVNDLQNILFRFSPRIVHFSGHGDGNNGLILVDRQGQAQMVSTEALADLFSLFKDTIQCVFLNACYSEIQAEAIHRSIPFVIGMNQRVDDRSAIIFAQGFYRAIGANRPFEEAYEFGCNAIKLQNHPDISTFFKRPQPLQISPQNPYQGLSAFGEEDAAFFFGREEITQNLFEKAHQQQLVPVIGTSGSGKSSVVFAGLIPLLRQEGIWLIESFRPRSQPFDELALALVRQLEPELGGVEKAKKVGSLASSLKEGKVKLHQVASQILENRPNQRFLLVVDQFEEIYTQCEDREEQQNFIKALLAAVNRRCITLVFTLRADFYGYALSYPPFCKALQRFNHIPLGLMGEAELQAAIEQPAQKLNVRFPSHLVARILDDIGNEPGSLPLLEFALTELWNKRQDNEPTYKTYNDIGGVQQALITHAENVFSRLSQLQQQQARQVFLKLVQLGEATEDTRRVATKNDIGQQNWELITYLAGNEARLLVTGRNDQSKEETVEVAHEVLIQKWGRLREWIEQDRGFLIWLQELRSTSQQWKKRNLDEGSLLRGRALDDAQDWMQKRPADLTREEQAYIQSSQKKRQLNNRLILVGTMGGTLILAGGLGFAWWQTEIQRQQAQKNEIKALTSSSEKLLIANQNFDALIYGLEAGQKLRQAGFPDSDLVQPVEKVLQQAIASLKEFNRLEKHSDWVYGVRFSPVNNNIVSISLDKTVKLWQRDGNLLKTLKHEDKVHDVSFCPKDGRFATASKDKTVKIWTQKDDDTSYQHSLKHKFSVLKVSFAPNCRRLVTASEKQVLLWNVGEENPKILYNNGMVDSVSFNPNGDKIAIASKENSADQHTIRILELNGKELHNFKVHKDKVYNISFSPDGNTIATASWDKTVKLWRLDGTLRETIKHEDRVNSVSFSKDNIIASGGVDNTVKLWKIDTKSLPIYAHNKPVRSVSFHPKLDKIATASEDGTAKLWEQNGHQLNLSERSVGSNVNGVSFNPDGDVIAIASADGKTHLWNTTEGKRIKPLIDRDLEGSKSHSNEVFSASYSRDGTMIATASADRTAKLWRSSDGEYIRTLRGEGDQGHSNYVVDVSFSLDGKMIATASDDHTAKIWKKSDGTLCATLKGHTGEVNGIDFSSDGVTIATASDDYTVKLWKLDDLSCEQENTPLNSYKTLEGHQERIIDVKFSPDGQRIASASFDKTVKLWNKDGEVLHTFQGHNDWVWSVDFSSDGKTLVSGSNDTTIRFWNVNEEGTQNLNLDDWLEKGCSQVGDYLKNISKGEQSDKQICN
jgi:WD40 repeat protein